MVLKLMDEISYDLFWNQLVLILLKGLKIDWIGWSYYQIDEVNLNELEHVKLISDVLLVV